MAMLSSVRVIRPSVIPAQLSVLSIVPFVRQFTPKSPGQGTFPCLFGKIRSLIADGHRNDDTAGGWIFPKSALTDSQLPAVQIGIGDPNSDGGEQRFDIYPEDLAFADIPEISG